MYYTIENERLKSNKGSVGMTIKEVSEKYGVSCDTLRYYERAGAIPPVSRSAGGIRRYDDEDIRWIELAVCLRGAGIPIESVAEYVRLYKMGDSTKPERLELLRGHRAELIAQRDSINEALECLDAKIERYENS